MNYTVVTGDLYHYGVKGMKWGVRRYQNKDGSLTPAGKKKAKQEYREDNRTAYELGKNATVYGRASARSMARTIRYENKLDKQFQKDPEALKGRTKRLRKNWFASAKTTEELTKTYVDYRDKGEKHCKELIEKYGKEAVTPIKYKDIRLPKGEYSPSSIKVMNERTNNATDYARSGLITTTSMLTSAALNVPIVLISRPTSTAEKALRLEDRSYVANRKALRDK